MQARSVEGTGLENVKSVTTTAMLGYEDRVENRCRTCQHQLLGCYQMGCTAARELALAFVGLAAECAFAQARTRYVSWTTRQEDAARDATLIKILLKLDQFPPTDFRGTLLDFLNDQYAFKEATDTSGKTFIAQTKDEYIDKNTPGPDGDIYPPRYVTESGASKNPGQEIIEAEEIDSLRNTEIPTLKAEFKQIVDLMIDTVSEAHSNRRIPLARVLLLYLDDFKSADASKDYRSFGPAPASDRRVATYLGVGNKTISRIRNENLTPLLNPLRYAPDLNKRQKIAISNFLDYLNQTTTPAVEMTCQEQEEFHANQETITPEEGVNS